MNIKQALESIKALDLTWRNEAGRIRTGLPPETMCPVSALIGRPMDWYQHAADQCGLSSRDASRIACAADGESELKGMLPLRRVLLRKLGLQQDD